MKSLRGDGFQWFQLAEHTFDSYMMIQQRKKLLGIHLSKIGFGAPAVIGGGVLRQGTGM